jgi:hypothetical protein
VIAGSCLLALLSTPHVRAQERLPLELDWQAPAECPSAEAVRGELQRIARVRPGFSLTPLGARAVVERRGAGYATALHTEHAGQAGERALEAADCDTLVRTVTLVLALAFGAGVEVEDTSAPPATTAPEPAQNGAAQNAPAQPTVAQADQAAATDEHAAEQEPAASGSRDHTLDWSLLAGAGVQLGLLPMAAFAASVGAEVAFGAFSIGVRANAWPGVTDAIGAQLEARFDGAGGALQGCGRMPWSSLLFAACGEMRAAALRGRSSGTTDDGSATAPWYALAAAASLTWPRASVVSLRLQAALAASLDRPRFVITDLQQVHRVPQLVPDFAAFLIVTP